MEREGKNVELGADRKGQERIGKNGNFYVVKNKRIIDHNVYRLINPPPLTPMKADRQLSRSFLFCLKYLITIM